MAKEVILLTPIQIEILWLQIRGLRDGEIATRLNLSRSGVQWNLSQAQLALGVCCRAALLFEFTRMHVTGQLISGTDQNSGV